MNVKYSNVDSVDANNAKADNKVETNNNVVFVDGTVDWNSSTAAAGVYPVLDQNGNPIIVPVGAILGGRDNHNLLLKQVGPDVTASSPTCLAGGESVVLYLTNQINGVYQTGNVAGVITPVPISTSATATTIGMSGTGYVLEGTIYMTANKAVTNNSLQSIYLCARFSGPATNAKSKLQVSTRYIL